MPVLSQTTHLSIGQEATEAVDLCALAPCDRATVVRSVAQTGRLAVLEEGT